MYGHDMNVGICAASNKLRVIEVGCQRELELGRVTVGMRKNLDCLWVDECQCIKERRHSKGLQDSKVRESAVSCGTKAFK